MTFGIEQARAWYSDADPTHDFEHVLRVYRMAERLGREERADLEIIRAAALLHDIQGSPDGSNKRARHHHQSAELAGRILRQAGWSDGRIERVEHCIRAHRYRSDGETPQTLEAKILFDADKLDALGAIGAARAIGYASIHRQPVYAQPSDKFLQSGEKEPGEPHSAYHEFVFKLVKIKDRLYTPTAQRLAQDRHAYLEKFFQQLQAEIDGVL